MRRAAAMGGEPRRALRLRSSRTIARQHRLDNYDPVYGGFGERPKFPHTDAIDLLLYAHRRNDDPDVLHMARKTLEFMCAGEVYDQEWGGFFRYATRRDWSRAPLREDAGGQRRAPPQRPRALPHHRQTSSTRRSPAGTIEYLEWKLRDPERGYFYGSQDADEEFYKLSKEGRERAEEPYIDRTCYTSWNAMMISAYLEASWTLDRPDLRDAALKALDFLWTECRDPEQRLDVPLPTTDGAHRRCSACSATRRTPRGPSSTPTR